MKEALLTKIQKAVIYFVLYSVIGWCYEVFLEVVVYRWGFSNRGVLLGPYCVVYGFGALILIASLGWLKERRICLGRVNVTPALVFVGIVVITTLVELAASYIMEFTHGEWLWDYTRFAFNFQGRVALNPSIRFGIGGDFPARTPGGLRTGALERRRAQGDARTTQILRRRDSLVRRDRPRTDDESLNKK